MKTRKIDQMIEQLKSISILAVDTRREIRYKTRKGFLKAIEYWKLLKEDVEEVDELFDELSEELADEEDEEE